MSPFRTLRTEARLPAEAGPEGSRSVQSSSARKPAKILVVEDNEVVSDFLESALLAYGYVALRASTPEEAVQHCKREGKAIRALFMDVRLGSYEGYQIVQKLLRICPDVKLIFMSGYPIGYLRETGLLPAGFADHKFLQKPFLPNEILSIVKSL